MLSVRAGAHHFRQFQCIPNARVPQPSRGADARHQAARDVAPRSRILPVALTDIALGKQCIQLLRRD